MTVSISIFDEAGAFAENKDVARELRTRVIQPALAKSRTIVLDFADVDLATQSFIHALLSEVIRVDGASALDRIEFKNCNPSVRNLIEIVSTYSQDAVEED